MLYSFALVQKKDIILQYESCSMFACLIDFDVIGNLIFHSVIEWEC